MEKSRFHNQGQLLIGIIFVIVVAGLITGGLYFYLAKQMSEPIEPPEPIKCLDHNDCKENEVCDSNTCQIIICDYCKYVENRQCKNYECCSDVDCDDKNSETIDKCLNPLTKDSKCEYEVIQRCDDNTIYSECSSIKPIYCENGNLIDKCSSCGCPAGQQCQADESCVTPTFSVSLSVDPSSGNAPLDIELTAQVSGIDTGPANYIFYCDRSDAGTDVMPGYNNRIDYVFTSSYTDVCNYPSEGTYTAKVIVERGGLTTEDRVTINVATLQCTSGSCCDTSTNTFRPSTYQCQNNVNVEYGCPWGSDLGDDVGIKYQDRYCSGISANCDGSLQWDDWSVYDDCTSNEACSEGVCTALICADGTSYNQCSTNQPLYCQNGILINNCSTCGCSSGQQCQADESCITPAFSLSVGPNSGTVTEGDSISTTVTVDSMGGFAQTVDFSFDLPPGTTGSLSPTSCESPCSSTMTINAFADGIPLEGTYDITVTGASGTLTKTAIYTLAIIHPFFFDLSVSSVAPTSVIQGNSVSVPIDITLISGTSESVGFSASAEPIMVDLTVDISFSPTSCNPTCSSTMTIMTSPDTPAGTFPITVTALTRTVTYNLTVTEATLSLVANPGFESGSGGMPTGWTINQWGGNGPSSFEWISDGSTVRSGVGSAKITSSVPNDAMWIQNVSVEPYNSYLFKGWIKTENVVLSDTPGGWSTGANLSVYLSFNRSPGIWGTQDWIEESLFFCSIASDTVTVAARIGYSWSLVTGTVFFDDMSFEKLDPPFGGQHVVICFLPEHRSLLTDPNSWLQKLDDAYLALHNLTGQTPYNGDKILIQEIVNYAGGLMIAGNPILWLGDYVPDALEAINTQNDLSFGPIHELSHDFDLDALSQHYAGGSPINSEHWANFKLTYVADVLSNTYPTATFYQSPVGYVPIGEFSYQYFVEGYALPWIDSSRTDWQNMSGDAYTGLLYLLKEDIGWEPFRQTFRDFATLTESPPATDLEKVELFAHLLSGNAGVDLTPQFVSWGFPISPP